MNTPKNSACIINRQDIGERIFEERSRLGLTQSALADLIGSSRVSIVKYESGNTLPSAEVLTAFERAGIDVRYILVGIKNDDMRIVRDRFRRAFEEVSRQANANGEQLSDEVRLDLAWRIYDAFTALEATK